MSVTQNFDTFASPDYEAPSRAASTNEVLNYRAYVINLPSAPQRLQQMEDGLQTVGIPWVRIEAVNGRELKLPIPEFSQWRHRLCTGRRPILPELGCYFSHIRAFREFLQTSDDYALILEDDCLMDADLKTIIHQALQHKKHWEILRLSSVSQDRTIPIIPLDAEHHLGVCLTRSKGSDAYLISRKGAEIFLRKLIPMKLAYDLAYDLEFLYGLKALSVTPYPCRQDQRFATQIQTRINDYKYSSLRYLTVFPFRAIIETRRVIQRSLQYAHLRLLGHKRKTG